jgi:hypothetical protein
MCLNCPLSFNKKNKGEHMSSKDAIEIFQEIRKFRQRVGTISMVMDEAQAKFILDSMLQALQTFLDLFKVSRITDPSIWPDDAFGSQPDSLTVSYELAITAIATVRMFIEAIPQDFELVSKHNILNRMNSVEQTLKEFYGK